MTQSLPDSDSVVLPLDWDVIRAEQERLLETAERAGYSESSRFAIRLSLEEAVANAFKHGNKEDPQKTTTLSWQVSLDRLVIEVEDQGEGFDPDSLPDPTAPEYLERPHGRGVMLIRAYMSSAEYHNGGRKLRMEYEKPDGDQDS